MSAIKCPSCGYRISASVNCCVNCGETISTESSDEELFEDDDSSSIADPSPHELIENGKRALVPYGGRSPAHVQRALREQRKYAELQPYQAAQVLEQYQIPTLQPFQITEEDDLAQQEPWLTDRLPWYFFNRHPQLAGTVIHTQNELQYPDYPDVVRALVDILSEFIWAVPNQPTHREGEKIQVTIFRIRTNDGSVKDARLLGYLRGANVSLGDVVSFWGWQHRGSLTARRGYNHTSQAVITTNVLSMLLPALIILGIIGFIFFLAFTWSNILSLLHLQIIFSR